MLDEHVTSPGSTVEHNYYDFRGLRGDKMPPITNELEGCK
jgi:hypothetical protein